MWNKTKGTSLNEMRWKFVIFLGKKLLRMKILQLLLLRGSASSFITMYTQSTSKRFNKFGCDGISYSWQYCKIPKIKRWKCSWMYNECVKPADSEELLAGRHSIFYEVIQFKATLKLSQVVYIICHSFIRVVIELY